MGRRQIVEGLEKSERQKRRATLGSLKSLVLRPATITRYQKAFQCFISYLKSCHLDISSTKSGLDQQLVDYLEFLLGGWRISILSRRYVIINSVLSTKREAKHQPSLEDVEDVAAP